MRTKILGLAVSSLFFMSFSAAQAEDCDLKYTIKGWAAFYKTSQGTGTVTCPSGKSAKVKLSLKGGGFTFGAYEVTEGKGRIRGVEKIDDIYGNSFMMDGDAGFGKSVEGRWAPKGSRTRTLSGKGNGYNLGFAFGALNIQKP
ncbi:conserved hypothetical protein [Bathymodiolus platifrons methanotrophic gill symbiont]|uniref:hypothetical protein n=1 Tax=Bathymodiolus platifrons methanotrophic gill symbiont TaxID=113268 RepID=UPI000B419509|nr:hypothetical protein [Bathymodiolus platifrons methanotrophic gill symbiont]GAW85264.1 conserved hypothetical protein [Bathymodiolus platifrons methanotrophic gill symbiont]GFO74466.1 hypothetical protein BPLS_P1216 [Bathymodiolus platifrons methanotrophic gill symbiont]